MKTLIIFDIFSVTEKPRNILNWRADLAKIPVYKGLHNFSSPSTTMDLVLKEKLYHELEDGMYHLTLAKGFDMALRVEKLGNSSYVLCLHEPRVVSGFDFNFKLHLCFVGKEEVLREHLVMSNGKLTTTVFNDVVPAGIIRDGVTLDFLKAENYKRGGTVRIIEDILTEHEAALEKAKTVAIETNLTDIPAIPEEPVEEVVEETSSYKTPAISHVGKVTRSLVAKRNMIKHVQTLIGYTNLRYDRVVECFAQLLRTDEIDLHALELTGLKDNMCATEDIRFLDEIIGYSFKKVDVGYGESYGSNKSLVVKLELKFDDLADDVTKFCAIEYIFKHFISKYAGTIHITSDDVQELLFLATDESGHLTKIVLPLLKLKSWLERSCPFIESTAEDVEVSEPEKEVVSSWATSESDPITGVFNGWTGPQTKTGEQRRMSLGQHAKQSKSEDALRTFRERRAVTEERRRMRRGTPEERRQAYIDREGIENKEHRRVESSFGNHPVYIAPKIEVSMTDVLYLIGDVVDKYTKLFGYKPGPRALGELLYNSANLTKDSAIFGSKIKCCHRIELIRVLQMLDSSVEEFDDFIDALVKNLN